MKHTNVFPNRETNTNALLILKKEIEKTFGQPVATARECEMLCAAIYTKTAELLNTNTIRRFFGLVKSDHNASRVTLNILSAYCGFSSFDELIDRVQTENEGSATRNVFLLEYLVMIFKNTIVNQTNDETFNEFVSLTIEHLNSDIALMGSLQREIVKTKNGIEFYFEQNINYDKLNSFYGDGLHYYLNEAVTTDKKIFAYSLLCLKDWFAGDHTALNKKIEYIKTLSPNKVTSFTILGMYYSACLLHADGLGIDNADILIEAHKKHLEIETQNSIIKCGQSFEYIYCQTLILTRQFEHALYYINYILKKFPDVHTKAGRSIYQNLLLLKAIALSKLKMKDEATRIYNELKPSQFNFLSSRLYTALYLILTKFINKANKNTDIQLMSIINEAGFKKLQVLAA